MSISLTKATCQALIGFLAVQIASADWQTSGNEQQEIAKRPELSEAMRRENTAMTAAFNHSTLAYRATVLNMMLGEVNYFAARLSLQRPIKMTDLAFPYPRVGLPWFSIFRKQYPPYHQNFPETIFTNNIYDTNIPRETRLRAVTIGISGMFGTTNCLFCFNQGRLLEVMRMSGPDEERYSRNLADLVGKPSLITQVQAYELATQWLAAVDVDMAKLSHLKWTVNQMHYATRGMTNKVDLPLYYVDFNYKNPSESSNLLSMGQPPVSVEVLGTTKELQDLKVNDLTFSRRPVLLITNGFDLVCSSSTPVPTTSQKTEEIQTNNIAH